MWTAPHSDLRIEIQFHTPESLIARESNQHLHEFERQSELWPATPHPDAARYVRLHTWSHAPEAPENGQVAAILLGFPTIEDALRDLAAAPTRLAYLVNLPTGELCGLVQLRRLLVDFAHSAALPQASRAAAIAAVIDALVPGLDDGPLDIRRAAQLLTAAAVVHRGDLDNAHQKYRLNCSAQRVGPAEYSCSGRPVLP
ncbi:MAG: hypothetical protein JWN03_5910 [Nocardia sp.]|uniref:hypothetical protein n=1 Tax=Nocardia sp. TaxID=1821 RepID=UPI00263757C8|nr:hypothetical protein [Nocardia sp.]MCU1645635.1 hypothetical protein [Nocardia sp.]